MTALVIAEHDNATIKAATLNTVTVELAAGSEHSFRASGTTVVVSGFLAVYEEGKDSKSADDDDEGRKLPLMKPGAWRRTCKA